MPVKNRFAELYEEYAERTKKTQKEIASELGVAPSVVSRYRRGHVDKSFNLELLAAACRVFEVDTSDVLEYVPEESA
jgi:transcriptional regulator with XRE-family HTH domain